MKKILSLLLILVCLLSSCTYLQSGSEGDTTEESTTEVPTKSTSEELSAENATPIESFAVLNEPLRVAGGAYVDSMYKLESWPLDISEFGQNIAYAEVVPIKSDDVVESFPFKTTILLIDTYEKLKTVLENTSELKTERFYNEGVFEEYFFVIIARRLWDPYNGFNQYSATLSVETNTMFFISNAQPMPDQLLPRVEYVTNCCEYLKFPKSLLKIENGEILDMNDLKFNLYIESDVFKQIIN